MTQKFLKPFVAVAAVSMALAAPATAQIAKFHVMTPAMPGMAQVDRISSAEDALGDFVGSTAGMAAEQSATLGQMRDAESIIAGTGQGIERSGDDTSIITDQLAQVFVGPDGDSDYGPKEPPARPEFIASVSDDHGGVTVASRPEMGRQVVVKTRTKSPRGGSKIKSGGLWSVGEFR